MIDTIYIFPWNVYKKYFPNGNEEEFDKAFVSFDLSQTEFEELIGEYPNNGRFVCYEGVMFDRKFIKTPMVDNRLKTKKIKNTFRQ